MPAEPAAERAAELAGRPCRLADWEEKDGRVVVIRPRPETRGLQGLRDRYHYWMAPSRVRLDEVGSLIWRGMNGSATIAELAAMVPADENGEPEAAVERVGMFLRVLLDHGLASIEPG